MLAVLLSSFLLVYLVVSCGGGKADRDMSRKNHSVMKHKHMPQPKKSANVSTKTKQVETETNKTTKTLGTTQEDPSMKTNKKEEKKSEKKEETKKEKRSETNETVEKKTAKEIQSEVKERTAVEKKPSKIQGKKEEAKKPEKKASKQGKPSETKPSDEGDSKLTGADVPPNENVEVGTYEELIPPPEGLVTGNTQDHKSEITFKYNPPPLSQRPKRPETLVEQDPHDKNMKTIRLVDNADGFE